MCPISCVLSEVNLLEGDCGSQDDLLRRYDVLCVGDMLYDASMGELVLAACRRFLTLGPPGRTIYLGDPGRWVAQEAAAKIRTLFPWCVAQYRLPHNVQMENSGLTVGHVWRNTPLSQQD